MTTVEHRVDDTMLKAQSSNIPELWRMLMPRKLIVLRTIIIISGVVLFSFLASHTARAATIDVIANFSRSALSGGSGATGV